MGQQTCRGSYFGNVPPVLPPRNLLERIIERIRIEKKISAFRRRIALFSAMLVGSFGALCAASAILGGAFAESGLVRFLSLVISDTRSVLTNGYDFTLFFFESLPIVYLILFLLALLIFLTSMRSLTRSTNALHAISKLAGRAQAHI